MNKLVLHILLIAGLGICQAQICPKLIGPFDGDENVKVTTEIKWEKLSGQSIYLISLGTSPGATDIMDPRTSGIFANFTPPKGLPEKTRIYVSLQIVGDNLGGFDCVIGSFITEDVVTPPSCTTLRDPLNNAVFVREEVNIVWNYAPLAIGYRITIGTSLGGSDIVENFNVGNSLFYDPPHDLPLNAIVYVKIIPFNENGAAVTCSVESFAVRIVSSSLECTQLTYPTNGAVDIPKSTVLEWHLIDGASGYKVSVSTSPSPTDIFFTAFSTETKTDLLELESTHKYYVTIVPYNDAGEAIGCTNESFTTILDCGPFTDVLTGEVVILNPVATVLSQIEICNNQLPFVLTAPDTADGYRWYKINANGTTDLISENTEIELIEPGNYLYEIYDSTIFFEKTIECTATSEFTVVLNEGPTITKAEAIEQSGFLKIEVNVEGSGTSEYSLDDEDGHFQNSNVFENVPLGLHTVFARNKDGCGISKKIVKQAIKDDDFPKFFTPNGDGINDIWQLSDEASNKKNQMGPISIFNRLGVLLLQIKADSPGWDGTLNGRPLPSSEYWFKAIVDSKEEFIGHFSLIR